MSVKDMNSIRIPEQNMCLKASKVLPFYVKTIFFFLSIFRRFRVHNSEHHRLMMVLGTSNGGQQMAQLSRGRSTKMLAGQEVAGWKAGLRSETNF